VKSVLAAIAIACSATGAFAADAIQIATAARSIRPGEVVLLTATTSQPLAAMRARAFDRDLATFQLDANRWQSLLGIDLDTKPGTYEVSFESLSEGRTVTTTTVIAIAPRVFGRRVLAVDDAFVNPPDAVVARIRREAAELERLWSQSEPRRLWSDGFIRPVPGRANSAFGTRSVFNGQARQPHGGADFLSPAGTAVHAPSGGRVVLAHDLYFTGNTIVIDHGLGVFSLLAHLSVVNVREGDAVARGETIGEVGATGRVTGPHLHWAVRINGARVDPLAVLATLGPPADARP
jgi:murein DD-endopeptidase MepM/ murein hydrolase activator NlpD